MLRLSCILLLILVAAIHTDNLYRYHHTLQSMRRQAYETNVFRRWPHRIFFHFLLLLFASHLLMAAIVAFAELHGFILLMTALFMVFSLFALCMVRAMLKKSKIISERPVEIINTLVVSIAAKDQYTLEHSKHVMQLCELIYGKLPREDRKQINLQMLKDAALLHDIGKLHIPDKILQKPGKLGEEELLLIRQHPKFGYDMLNHSSFRHISKWVLYHHERADGCGYYGVPADEVPLEAKILAVADTYSALSTERSYQSRLEYSDAIDTMLRVAGTQLDAGLVGVFRTIHRKRVDRIAPRFERNIPFAHVQSTTSLAAAIDYKENRDQHQGFSSP